MGSRIAFFAALALALSLSSASAPAADVALKAVMQINSPNVDVVVRGLKNAVEISDDAKSEGTAVDLRLVVFGRAVDLFETSGSEEVRKLVQDLSKRGNVHFFVDQQTLKRIRIDPKRLLPGMTLVPSGAYHLLKLERDGYVYIKP